MFKALSSFFSRKNETGPAVDLYRSIVAQARQPGFYRKHGVPDTLDGRFDMVVLHAFLVSRRLKRMNTPESQQLNQSLFDLMFADMDSSLREIGIGDLSVGKKVKAMAQAFYGRVEAYEAGLEGPADDTRLAEALRRNLFGTIDGAQTGGCQAMAGYVRAADALLAARPDAEIMAGGVVFPAA